MLPMMKRADNSLQLALCSGPLRREPTGSRTSIVGEEQRRAARQSRGHIANHQSTSQTELSPLAQAPPPCPASCPAPFRHARFLLPRRYDLLAGAVKKLAARLKHLPADNALRIRVTEELLEKLERMGLIDVASSLAKAEAITASAYARRRLPVVLVRMRMSQTVKDATELVKHGHIRVGPEVITDPAYLVTRPMEDFVTWVDTSKIKRTVMRYNDKLDDFDLLGE